MDKLPAIAPVNSSTSEGEKDKVDKSLNENNTFENEGEEFIVEDHNDEEVSPEADLNDASKGDEVNGDKPLSINSQNNKDNEVVVIEEKLVFSGSDPDTIEFAKSFWKSVTLQPPIESSLTASNIRQRLPKAPDLPKTMSSRPSVKSVSREDIALRRFFQRANQNILLDRTERIKRLAYHRMQMLQLLEKRKRERVKKELVSEDFKPPIKGGSLSEMGNAFGVNDQLKEDDQLMLYTEEELQHELEMLDTFEKSILREVKTPDSLD